MEEALEEKRSRQTRPVKPITSISRKLRQQPTDAEERLWYYLRNRRFLGFKFRRQSPKGRNVADFVCEEAKLVIEVDGGQHSENAADLERTAFLNSAGYHVIRFWNNDVLSSTDGVLEEIARMLKLSGGGLTPSP